MLLLPPFAIGTCQLLFVPVCRPGLLCCCWSADAAVADAAVADAAVADAAVIDAVANAAVADAAAADSVVDDANVVVVAVVFFFCR